jgi:hypothetical protein
MKTENQPQSQEEFLSALNASESFLMNLGLHQLGEAPNPNIVDKDGLVTYLNASTNPPPAKLLETQKKVSAAMEGLTGIVVAAVLKIANGDDKKKHDPKLWNMVFEKAIQPFFGAYSNSKEEYHKDVKGVEVATNFINFLLNAVVSQGPALAGLTRFLSSQGESIRIQAGKEGDGYEYAVVSIIHEIYQRGEDDWVYIPKIKFYFTSFTRQNYTITSSCASYNHFKMDFELVAVTAAFQINKWEQDKAWRDRLNAFIDKYTKAKIDESENYLDSIFDSVPELVAV